MAHRRGETTVLLPVFFLFLLSTSNCLETKEETESVIVGGGDLSLRSEPGGGYRLQLVLGGVKEVFQLTRREERAGMWVAGEEGELTGVRQEAVPLYEDVGQGASLLLHSGPSSRGVVVRGVLGAGRSIQPVADSEAPGLISPHRVTTGQGLTSEAADSQEVEEGGRGRAGRQGRAVLSDTVYPEILVVVDYAFYRQMNKDTSAVNEYIMSYFNAVNMRFATMLEPSVKLNIAGIVVASSQKSLPYIALHTSQIDMLDAPSCLHSMGQYYYKTKAKLPVYDMVVTLTGLDMARMKNGRMTRATAGYAYVGGACVRNSRLLKISSVALVEDSGAYSGVVVTAHEIGHLLGAVHDGDTAPSYLSRSPGAKTCPWSDGYMMSDFRRTSRGLRWSDCSTRQMKYFLRTSTASCLYNTPHSSSHPLAGPRVLAGAGLSLNAQCQADRGTNACYHDQRVCVQLFCYYKKNGSCYATRPAAEGSTCGRGKHCLGGKCVIRSRHYGKERTTRKPKSVRDTLIPNQSKVMVQKVTPKSDKVTSGTKLKNAKKVKAPSPLKKGKPPAKNKGYWNSKRQHYKSRWSKRTKVTTKKPLNSDQARSIKSSSKVTKAVRKSQGHDEQPKLPPVTSDSQSEAVSGQCRDSIFLMGSLTCDQLFQRYHFHYCKRNKMVKKKCCVSYHKYCSEPR